MFDISSNSSANITIIFEEVTNLVLNTKYCKVYCARIWKHKNRFEKQHQVYPDKAGKCDMCPKFWSRCQLMTFVAGELFAPVVPSYLCRTWFPIHPSTTLNASYWSVNIEHCLWNFFWFLSSIISIQSLSFCLFINFCYHLLKPLNIFGANFKCFTSSFFKKSSSQTHLLKAVYITRSCVT